MGWGEIAKYLGLPPSHRDRNLGQIISGHLPISGTVSVAAQRLAGRLGTTPEAVQALLNEGAGYGTIVVAYKLAGEFGVAPQELVEERLAGAGWGQIRRGLSAAASATTESQEGPPVQGGPPDHAGAPEDKGPPDHAGPKDHSGPPDHAGPKDHNKHSK
jgi:transcriptional regulator with XRE-family HTH domain